MSEKLQHSVMKFDRSNKFDFCYYGQVKSLRLKSSVASNGQVNTFGGTILLPMVHKQFFIPCYEVWRSYIIFVTDIM